MDLGVTVHAANTQNFEGCVPPKELCLIELSTPDGLVGEVGAVGCDRGNQLLGCKPGGNREALIRRDLDRKVLHVLFCVITGTLCV